LSVVHLRPAAARAAVSFLKLSIASFGALRPRVQQRT
jgi:hypothetical protein